jgi:hypothetical protein
MAAHRLAGRVADRAQRQVPDKPARRWQQGVKAPHEAEAFNPDLTSRHVVVKGQQ